MEKKELRPICSLGMFDLLKGFTISIVIIAHTLELIPAMLPYSENFPPLANIHLLIGSFSLYALVIAIGFSIRKMKVRKCLSRIYKLYLFPYIVVALVSSVLYALNHYFVYSTYSSIWEGFRCLLSFLFMGQQLINTDTLQVMNIGPTWFLLSSAGAWFLLNLILHLSDGWKRNICVLLCCMIDYFGNLHAKQYNIPNPFMIFFMFKLVLGVYIGFLAKEHRWFEKKLSPLAIILLVVSLAAFGIFFKTQYIISDPHDAPLGVFTTLATGAVSFGIAYLATHINRRPFFVTNFFEPIGKNTFYIICIHTIENIAIPWKWLIGCIPEITDKHIFFMVLILRVAFIIFGMLIIKYFQEWGGFARIKEKLFRKKTA